MTAQSIAALYAKVGILPTRGRKIMKELKFLLQGTIGGGLFICCLGVPTLLGYIFDGIFFWMLSDIIEGGVFLFIVGAILGFFCTLHTIASGNMEPMNVVDGVLVDTKDENHDSR